VGILYTRTSFNLLAMSLIEFIMAFMLGFFVSRVNKAVRNVAIAWYKRSQPKTEIDTSVDDLLAELDSVDDTTASPSGGDNPSLASDNVKNDEKEYADYSIDYQASDDKELPTAAAEPQVPEVVEESSAIASEVSMDGDDNTHEIDEADGAICHKLLSKSFIMTDSITPTGAAAPVPET